jgi:hypothetical protein
MAKATVTYKTDKISVVIEGDEVHVKAMAARLQSTVPNDTLGALLNAANKNPNLLDSFVSKGKKGKALDILNKLLVVASVVA